MKEKLLLLTLICVSSFADAAAFSGSSISEGEKLTVNRLRDYRAQHDNVLRDPQTGDPLYRRKNDGHYVKAGIDNDIAFTNSNGSTVSNAADLLASYLAPATTQPQATVRSVEQTGIVTTPFWNCLLTLVKNQRLNSTTPYIARDCLGSELYEVDANGRTSLAVDLSDITNIPTLVNEIESGISSSTISYHHAGVAGSTSITEALKQNFEVFHAERARQGVTLKNPRTAVSLYRLCDDNVVLAAYDADLNPDLNNLVALTASRTAQSPVVPAGLATIFQNEQYTRIYEIIEHKRRSESRFLTDRIGGAIYTNLAANDRAVDMSHITDVQSLLKAVIEYYAVKLWPALPNAI